MQLREKVNVMLDYFSPTSCSNGICIAFATNSSTDEKLKYTFVKVVNERYRMKALILKFL